MSNTAHTAKPIDERAIGTFDYKSPVQLTRWLSIALWAHIIVLLLKLGAAAVAINLTWRISDGRHWTPEEMHGVASAIRLIDSARIGAGFALAIVAVLWLDRVRRNVRSVHEPQMRQSPGWAIGCWLIPVVNLFMPFQAVADIWRASWGRPKATLKKIRLPRFLLIWWALTLAAVSAVLASYFVLEHANQKSLATLLFNLLPLPLLIVQNLFSLRVASSICHAQVTNMVPEGPGSGED